MEIANNVKQRKRNTTSVNKNNLVAAASSSRSQSKSTKVKNSPKKKSSPHLKSLSKARKISVRRSKTARASGNNKNKTGKISRLLFTKTKKNSPEKNSNDSPPSKPSFYRTRNAATIAYEEKLEAVRAASLGPKKQTRCCVKKDSMVKSKEVPPEVVLPKYEPINETRILACGLWFRVGDVVSVYGNEKALSKKYYAQILLFLQDRFGEHYCEVRWLIPISLKTTNHQLPFSFSPFDFNNYLEGPRHTEAIKMANVNFVAHPPRGAGAIRPGCIGHLQPNPCYSQYRYLNEIKILGVPTPTATTTDLRIRNPYL